MVYRVKCIQTGQQFSFFSAERLTIGQNILFVPDDGGHFAVIVESIQAVIARPPHVRLSLYRGAPELDLVAN